MWPQRSLDLRRIPPLRSDHAGSQYTWSHAKRKRNALETSGRIMFAAKTPLQFFTVLLAAVMSSLPGGAAEIEHLGIKNNIYSPYSPSIATHVFALKGEISRGDTEKLKQSISRLTQNNVFCEVETPAVIQLDSPGGNFSEGLRLAALFRDVGLGTLVSNGERCLSACAVAFLGGTRHLCLDGDSQRYRRLEPKAELGFHAPRLAVPEVNVSTRMMGAAYNVAVKQIGTLIDEAKKSGIQSSLIVEMLKVGADKFYYIDTVGKAGRWGIDVAIDTPSPLSPQTLALACTNSAAWRADRFVPNVDYTIDETFQSYIDERSRGAGKFFLQSTGMYATACMIEIGRWPNGRMRYWVKFFDETMQAARQMYAGRRLEAADVSLGALHFFAPDIKLAEIDTER